MGLDQDFGMGVWSSAPWREAAASWIDGRLADAGVVRIGEISQPHLRLWATVLEVPTDHGRAWFKAAAPGTRFEVGLYEILHRVAPERVLAPVASDVSRGWLLLPDGGSTLGDRLPGADLVSETDTIMPLYGRLQRDLAAHTKRLLVLGVSDMRAPAMPARFDEALETVGEYVARCGDERAQTTYGRVAALRITFASWCERPAESPVPPSLDHNDLHPWNILSAGPDGADQARFYDWGDSVVAHPFASMLVPLTFLQHHLHVGPDDPGLLRVRDAYLKPFGDLAPRAELVEELELACRVGQVARALTWTRAVKALDAGDDGDGLADAPLESLSSLPDDSYLGGA